MDLVSNYRKFKKHLKVGGAFYTFLRGIKYFVFLVKKKRQFKQDSDNTLIKGKTKVICSGCGIRIFYNDCEVTKAVGLNVGINNLGIWTDSSKANWRILERGDSYFKIKIAFRFLPINQIWIIELKDEEEILWQIDMEVKKLVHIDEYRILCHLDTNYKSWINDYRQGDFSRHDNYWHNLCLDDFPSQVVGVRFPVRDRLLPSFSLESQGKNEALLPIIQKPPLSIDSYIIAFRKIESQEKNDYPVGHYHLFSGKLNLIKGESLLDKKIETLRQDYLNTAMSRKDKFGTPKKKFKVLLANLPWQRNGSWGVRAGSRWPHIKITQEKDYMPFPFFLAYSASLLKKNGFEVVLIDALAEEIPEQEFLIKVAKAKPNLFVAETSTPSIENDLNILRKLPEDLPKVLCGPELGIRNPDFLKKNGFINFVLVGEYEFTLLRLAESLEENRPLHNIQGLIYRTDSDIRTNPVQPLIKNLDSLPWPLREGLPMDKYNDCPGEIPYPSVQMVASRGCPYKCTFCIWPQLMYGGNSYRVRTVKDIVDEMEFLIEKIRFRSIYFDDDTFNIGKERMLEFASEIKQRKDRGRLLNAPWAIMARLDLMDEEILRNLKEAGLAAVKYGVESASQELLNRVNKNIDLKKAESIVRSTKKLGIKVHLTFMFGFPGETKETIQKTIDFAIKLDPDTVQFSIITSFPGTKYFNELKEKDLILSENWSEYGGNHRSPIRTEHLSGKDLMNATKRAYAIWGNHVWRKKIRKIERREYYQKLISSLKNYGLALTLQRIIYFLSSSLNSNLTKVRESLQQNGFRKASLKIRNRLSPKKVFGKYLEIAGIFDKKYAFIGPNCVQIDLTDSCNNNCIGCWCNSPLLADKRKTDKDTLDFRVVKELISELRRMGTRELYFSGGGEPFMHPNFFDIIEHAKKEKMACYINTNFTLVDEEKIKRLIDLEVDYLTVSTWVATAKTYKLTHPNKDEATFYRIQELISLLNSSKSNSVPHITLYNVVFNLNYQEIEQMVDFGLQTKSDAVEFSVIDTVPGATDKLLLSKEQCHQVLEQCFRIKQRCSQLDRIDKLQLLNLEHFIRRISNLGAQKAEYDSEFIGTIPCYVGWLFARIMPDGNVNSCLKSHRFPVGNIYQQSFKEIWNSPRQLVFRQKTLKFDTSDSFFSLIGNDPNAKVGCYKSCDNINSNVQMHNKAIFLTSIERKLLSICAKTLRGFKELK